MNYQDYIQAAQELSKIPGMERSPWGLYKTLTQGRVGAFLHHQMNMEDARGNKPERLGPWLNIDDFSDWSAAKIATNAAKRMTNAQVIKCDQDIDVFPDNLAVVQFINEAYKTNPQAVLAAIPKE